MLGNRPVLPALLVGFVVDCSQLHSTFLIMHISVGNLRLMNHASVEDK